MISKFSAFYVGHLELEDVGRDGTPADARRYPPERFAEPYWAARSVAQLMDGLGYHCLWLAEHHFQREGYEAFPNTVLVGTWLATQTEQLRFGCAFNVLPTWHPIRLAEDYAIADIVTGGRVVLGVGRGYHTREVESLGAPLLDQEANRELFDEQLEVLLKALGEDGWSHRGRHFTIPPSVPYRGYELTDVTVVPQPVHRPVEIWQAVSSGRSIAAMAQRGFHGMVTLTSDRILDEWVHLYRDEAAKAGRELELGAGLCWGIGLSLADTVEEAIRLIEPYHDERYKWFSPFGIVRYVDEQGRLWGSPGAPSGVPSIRDGVAQRAWLCGPPRLVAEQIAEIADRYPGLDQLMIHWPESMPRTMFEEQLSRFAAEVIPALAL